MCSTPEKKIYRGRKILLLQVAPLWLNLIILLPVVCMCVCMSECVFMCVFDGNCVLYMCLTVSVGGRVCVSLSVCLYLCVHMYL